MTAFLHRRSHELRGAVYHLHAVGISPSTVMFDDHDGTTQTMVVAACRQAATNAVSRGW